MEGSLMEHGVFAGPVLSFASRRGEGHQRRSQTMAVMSITFLGGPLFFLFRIRASMWNQHCALRTYR